MCKTVLTSTQIKLNVKFKKNSPIGYTFLILATNLFLFHFCSTLSLTVKKNTIKIIKGVNYNFRASTDYTNNDITTNA